jgi:hypothetical protein
MLFVYSLTHLITSSGFSHCLSSNQYRIPPGKFWTRNLGYIRFFESVVLFSYMVIIVLCVELMSPAKNISVDNFFWVNSKYTELKYIKNTVDWCPVLYKSIKNWARHKACKTVVFIIFNTFGSKLLFCTACGELNS